MAQPTAPSKGDVNSLYPTITSYLDVVDFGKTLQLEISVSLSSCAAIRRRSVAVLLAFVTTTKQARSMLFAELF